MVEAAGCSRSPWEFAQSDLKQTGSRKEPTMSKIRKLILAVALCASAFLLRPSEVVASDVALFFPTYDQCMSWCMTQYDFFTCDAHCSQYPSSE